MQKKNDTITFVIVNYKSHTELQKCLDDLGLLKDASSFEIIIINNDTVPITPTQNIFQKQKVYEINKNIGYGNANNIGLTHVTTKFVCFLNPDTHSFCPNLAEITSFLTQDKIIVSPQIRTESNTSEPWSVGTKITILQLLKNNCGLHKKPWLSKKTITTNWVSGAALFAPTQFLKELDGFDKDFFLYFEDVDLCQRAQDAGGTIQYIPQFYITHTNGVSSKTNTKIQKKYYHDSQDLFFQKHLGAFQTKLLRIARFLYIK